MDFVYPNFLDDSEESKRLVIHYLNNLLNSEMHLLGIYEDYMDKYIENKQNKK